MERIHRDRFLTHLLQLSHFLLHCLPVYSRPAILFTETSLTITTLQTVLITNRQVEGHGKWKGIQKHTHRWLLCPPHQWRTQEFFSGEGGSTNSVEDRENGDLRVVAP